MNLDTDLPPLISYLSLTVQSLTALNNSRHNSFNSFVAEGTWLYFLAEPGDDLQKIHIIEQTWVNSIYPWNQVAQQCSN